MVLYKIKKEKISDYKNKGLKGFLSFGCQIFNENLDKENGVYHYWRLKPNSQDEMILTKIKMEDLYVEV